MPRAPATPSTSLRRRLAAGLLASWLLVSPTGLVLAGPVADAAAPANQQPIVTTAPTGVAMVNIAAPNAAGLSYNRYQRFDVDPTGLLLNNSTSSLTAPLGVVIPANTNLGGRPASLIVNEVVTAIPSQLNGPLAVLGNAANVVIANSNGITCNGCTFLNTTQVQLTTGSVGFRDAAGAASSFDSAAGIVLQVGSGRIVIDGAGLSAPLARLDLVAETIGINAPVTVNGALNLLAGRQTVNAENLAILAGGAGNDKAGIGQDWAIDATAFGALNAGTIRVVATSAGMGVRSAAQLAASGGDLRISSNGDLSLADAGASQDIQLVAAGALVNRGTVAAGRNLGLTAGSVDNRGHTLNAQNGDLTLTAGGAVDNRGGTMAAANALSLQGGSLANAGGTVLASNGDVNVGLAGQFDNTGGVLAASRKATIQAGSVANAGGNLLAYGGDLAVVATGAIDNARGFVSAANGLTLQGASLSNIDGAVQALDGDLRLTLAGQLANTRGVLAAAGAATVQAGSVGNAAGSIVAYGGDLSLTASGAIDNSAGRVAAANGATLRGASLANGSGGVVLAANGDLAVALTQQLDNAGGWLDAARGASIQAGSAANAGGSIVARNGNLDLASTGAIDNGGGLVAASGALTLAGASLANAGGTVQTTNGSLAINLSGQFGNAGGLAAAGLGVSIQAGSIANAGGGIVAYGGDLGLTASGAIDNTDGLVAAANALALTGASFANVRGIGQASNGNLGITLTGQLDNSGGTLTASRGVAIQAGSANNAGGAIVAYGGDLGLTSSGALNNGNGLIAATGALTLSAASLASTGGRIQSGGDMSLVLPGGSIDLSGSQTGTLIVGGAFSVRAKDISNSDSFGHAGKVTLTADNSLSNTGILAAGGDLVVNVVGQCRNDGTVYVAGNLTLAADTLLNYGGISIDGGGAFTLVHALDNRAGARIDLAGNLDVAAGSIANAGTLATQAAATLDAATLNNSGTVAAATTLTARPTSSLVNTGTLASGGDAALTAASLTNGGTISSGGALSLTAPTFGNSGLVVSAGSLTLTSATSFANSGTVAGGTDAAFTLNGSASNTGGWLTAGNDLVLTTSLGSGLGGTVLANRDLTLHLGNYSYAGETAFLSGRDLIVTAASFSNSSTLGAYRNLSLTTTGGLTNSGQLVAGQDATFNVAGALTNNGTIETGRDLAVTAASLSNGTGTTTSLYFGQSTSMADYRYWVLTYITDPVVQGKLFNEITPDSQWHNSRFYLLNRWGYFMDSGLQGPYFSLWITQTTGNAKLNAGRHLTANIGGGFSNNSSTVAAGGNIAITAGSFANNAAQNSYHGQAFAGGGGHDLYAYGNSAAIVQAAGGVGINAGSSSNTGTIQGNTVYVGGSLVNGLTSYHQPTPASTLPHAVIDLSGAPTDADGVPLPAIPNAPGTANGLPAASNPSNGLTGMPAFPKPPSGATFTPQSPTLFSSVSQLALLAPIGQDYLENLLPADLKNTRTPFLMDAWLEQQSLRDAALKETGQATFLAGLSYDDGTGLNVDSQQRALLYQAAAKFATDNQIKLGVALSADQQKALTNPILWYVEQAVVGPDGQTYQALVPKLYLPEGQLADLANIAGGVIKGNDVTLDAGSGSIRNTGYIAAGNSLTVNAAELVNEARSAYWGSYTENVKGGYVEISGDRVQPGGFMSAATLNLNVGSVSSISGTFLEAGQDKAAQLQQQLGANFSQTQNIDHTFVTFHQDSGAGLNQLAIMAVAIAAAYFTAGAASSAIASAAGETAAASAAATATAAGASGAAAAQAAYASAYAASAASWSTVALAGAAGGMASSATTGLLTGNFDMGNVLKAGLTSGLTAGLTQGLGFNQMAGMKDVGTGIVQGSFDAAKIGDALVGIAGRGVVNAGVNSAIYGTSFGEGFKQSVISDAAAIGANAIGTAWGSGPNANPVMQTLAHAGLGAVTAKLRGQDVVAGAIGGATESILGNLVSDGAVAGNGGKALYAAAAILAGGLVADALGRDSIAAGSAAQNAALNNRLLHQKELTLAKRLAAQSNGRYTEAEIADALRWANNSQTDEAAYNNTTSAVGTSLADKMIPGQTTDAAVPFSMGLGANGNGVLVQNMNQIPTPSSDLMGYIQQNTDNMYSWNTGAWQVAAQVPSGGTPASAWSYMGANASGMSSGSGLQTDNRTQAQVDAGQRSLVAGIAGAPLVGAVAAAMPEAFVVGAGVNAGAQLLKGNGFSVQEMAISGAFGTAGAALSEANAFKAAIDAGGIAGKATSGTIGAVTNVGSDTVTKMTNGEAVTPATVGISAAAGIGGGVVFKAPAYQATMTELFNWVGSLFLTKPKEQ